jgi:GTP pyrophosphokinase
MSARGESSNAPDGASALECALAQAHDSGPDDNGARDVAAILGDLGLDEDTAAAAVVHRLLGAGWAPEVDIETALGAPVMALVHALTRMQAIDEYSAASELATQPGQVDRLKNLLLTMASDVRVVVAMLAGRLHDMRHLREAPEHLRARTARETLDLYAPLASRLGIAQFKWELEDLAFRELEPEAYHSLAQQLAQRRTEREAYIEGVVTQIRDRLAEQGIRADVKGRVKHLYSIWRKMQQKDLGFEQVFDARATRVLVDDVAQCYTALGVVHTLWKHVAREFDDYIANPKRNGYQSLHTAVVGPKGRALEVQIRTREMHVNAEYGVAAHWRYKEGTSATEDDEATRLGWLTQMLDGRGGTDSDGDLFDRFNAELLDDRVFAVTPQGRILDLPAGATSLDFAYQVHTELGHRCRGAKVNGKMVPLTTPLRSGDKVEVLTTRNGTPSRDWLSPHLGYLATARARAKVRHWFKHRDHDKNVASGSEVFQRELRRLGVTSPDRERLLARFNHVSFEEFLAGIGCGDISGAQIASALQQDLPQRAVPIQTPPRARPPSRPARGLQIQGVGNLLTHMARCCQPLPGEEVVGFVTRGRGVTIHRRDCANVLRMDEERRQRLLEVTWARGETDTYGVNVLVRAHDRKGLLKDVTTVLTGEGVDITAMAMADTGRANLAEIRMTIQIADLEHLSRVLDRIGQLGNVFEARRTD